jgi:hypothetical protein
MQEAYVIPNTLDHVTQGELQRYENNYKTLNLITTALGRNVYDRVSHLETAHDVWLKLCNIYEGSSEIKSSHKDMNNMQSKTFTQKLGESLMTVLLILSLVSVAYILVVLLHTLTMNVLSSCYMRLMIMFGAWKLLL